MKYDVILYWGPIGAAIEDCTIFESHTVEADSIKNKRLIKAAAKILADRGVHMNTGYRIIETVKDHRLDIDWGAVRNFIAIRDAGSKI